MFRRFACTALLLALVPACQKGGPLKHEMSAEEVAAQLASVKVEPGQWQSTTTILSVDGLAPSEAGQMVGKKTEISNCITPEQAVRPSANFLAAQQKSDCTYESFKIEAERLSGRMTCSGGAIPGRMVTAMTGKYGPTAYDVTMDMQSAGALRIKTRTSGRRVGECASEE